MKLNQRGVALTEFALVLPILIVLTFATVELGRALYEYNTLTKSVRDAVRYLSFQPESVTVTDPSKITAARNLAVYGKPVASSQDKPLAMGLSLTNVPASNITWDVRGSSPAINVVTVKISGYGFRPIVTSAFGIEFGNNAGLIPYGDIVAFMRSPS
jgi:Flp pilus assembly protein TadG